LKKSLNTKKGLNRSETFLLINSYFYSILWRLSTGIKGVWGLKITSFFVVFSSAFGLTFCTGRLLFSGSGGFAIVTV